MRVIFSLIFAGLSTACVNLHPPVASFRLAAPAATLKITTAEATAYRAQFLAGGPWNTVTATISRDGQQLAMATGTAFEDPATHARQANLGLNGLVAGGNYMLELAFGWQQGAALAPAGTLVKTGLSLASGDNMLQLDARARLLPAYVDRAPLGSYVDSVPASGPPAQLVGVKAVAVGLHDDYFYIDDNAIHRCFRDARGQFTTAIVAGAAGTANLGSVDGSGPMARFQSPFALAAAPDGALYVSDFGNNQIRKIDLDARGNAIVSTLAGTGARGTLDGPGGTAQISQPGQLAVSPDGSVALIAGFEPAIRLITTTGMVSTLARDASSFQDGPLSQAQFNFPQSIAVDRAGRIFIGDGGAPRIRMLTPNQGSYDVTTVPGTGNFGAADGPGTSASFGAPKQLIVDGDGNLVVLDGRVRKVTFSAGGSTTVSTLAGNGTNIPTEDGPAAVVANGEVSSVAVDHDGSLLACSGQALLRITAPGTPGSLAKRLIGLRGRIGLTTALPGADGPTGLVAFNPGGIAFDSAGNLYAVEGDTVGLAEFPAGDPMATPLDLQPGTPPPENDGDDIALFWEPSGLFTRDGLTFYFAHGDSRCIQRITRTSLDSTVTTVQVVAGTVGRLGSTDGPGTSALFTNPSCLTQGPDGAYYCGDRTMIRRVEVAADGTSIVKTVAGGPGSGAVDGPGTVARFVNVLDLAFDSKGQLWVADGGTANRIRKVLFAQDGTSLVGTVARGTTDFGNTPITIQGLAIGPGDIVYVADSTRIFSLTPDSVGQFLARYLTGDSSAFADGIAANARFGSISTLAVSPQGLLHVVDHGNALVRRIHL